MHRRNQKLITDETSEGLKYIIPNTTVCDNFCVLAKTEFDVDVPVSINSSVGAT